MTVMQLNTQIYNSLGELSTNEDYLKKAANYLKKLVEKMHASEEMDETQYIMSSPKMMEIIKEGDEAIKKGDIQTIKVEDLWK